MGMRGGDAVFSKAESGRGDQRGIPQGLSEGWTFSRRIQREISRADWGSDARPVAVTFPWRAICNVSDATEARR